MSRGIVHRLGADDILTDGLMVKENSNVLARGLTDNATDALGVTAGGTGATTFTDGEFITFSSSSGKFKSSGISLPDTYSKAAMDSFFESKQGGKYQVAFSNVTNAYSMQTFTQVALIPSTTSNLLFSPMPWTFPDFWTVRFICIGNTVAHGYTVDDRIELYAMTSADGASNIIRHTAYLQADGTRVGMGWTLMNHYIVKKAGDLLSMTNATQRANFSLELTAKKFTA